MMDFSNLIVQENKLVNVDPVYGKDAVIAVDASYFKEERTIYTSMVYCQGTTLEYTKRCYMDMELENEEQAKTVALHDGLKKAIDRGAQRVDVIYKNFPSLTRVEQSKEFTTKTELAAATLCESARQFAKVITHEDENNKLLELANTDISELFPYNKTEDAKELQSRGANNGQNVYK